MISSTWNRSKGTTSQPNGIFSLLTHFPKHMLDAANNTVDSLFDKKNSPILLDLAKISTGVMNLADLSKI